MEEKKIIVRSFALDIELLNKLREMAKAQDRTVTSLVRRILRDYIKNLQDNKKE